VAGISLCHGLHGLVVAQYPPYIVQGCWRDVVEVVLMKHPLEPLNAITDINVNRARNPAPLPTTNSNCRMEVLEVHSGSSADSGASPFGILSRYLTRE